MPKHTWATSVKTDNGGGPVDSIDLFGSAEQNIGGNALGLKGLEVGITDVEEVDLAVTVANIVSFFIKSTQDTRLRINSETNPAQEFQLTANKVFGWNNANIPLPMANPLTTSITKLFFYNKGTGTATPAVALVTAGFLLKQETQTS